MDVLICTAKEQREWREALAVCLPEARIHTGDEAPPCDYAVLWKPPEGLFARQPRLRAMFSLGAGVNGLLAMPTLPRDVPLVRMEDCGMAAQMAEYALYVALRGFRRFAEYAQAQREGRWAPQSLRLRCEYRIGVLGLGVLGGAAAAVLAEFGFRVTGWSRTAKVLPGIRCLHGGATLDRVLADSDLLLLLLPLTEATRGLIDRARLERLPVGATLANLARGEILDESSLLEVLDSGRIGEAFLDVFQHEPLPPEHPFWSHPRVRMTPHVAALTPYAVACAQVADKIRLFESGLPVGGVVDRVLGY